ncbi:MAG: N-methyl-L-tryptophan oxidase [Sciscionella sp.]
MPGYDVIVLGLGGMGSAAAYRLAQRGQRVLGLDGFDPAHDQGSSHGGSRIIRQAFFEDPAYTPLLLRAYELWAEVERASATRIMHTTGGVMVGAPESRTVAGSVRSAREWGLRHEILDAAQLAKRFPTMAPRQGEIALYEPKAGFVVPEASVRAHLALARGAGAQLHFREPVVDWFATDSGVAVRTARGHYRAEKLVVCPGAWAPQLLSDLGIPLVVERQVQYWFQPRGGIAPYREDVHPIYIWEGAGGRQVYGFPMHGRESDGVKVALFRGGVPCTPQTIDRKVAPGEIAAIAEFAGRHLPNLPGRFLRAKTCMYTSTPDEHFVIAPHPEHENVTVACGFSGHGFKFASVVGEILADLSVDGATSHSIELFDPRRSQLASR